MKKGIIFNYSNLIVIRHLADLWDALLFDKKYDLYVYKQDDYLKKQ